MAIAQGIKKKLIAKKQAALGTKAVAAGAQSYARVTSDLSLSKDTFQSSQILESQQTRDMRHGMEKAEGTLSDELFVGVHQAFVESTLRAAATAGVSIGALTDVTAATDGAATYTGTFTTAGGDYIAAGFKTGMVTRWAGWTDTSNNDINYLITALTTTIMTVKTLNKTDIGAEAAAASVTATAPGMTISIPETGHTADYWTIEHYFSDISQSHSFLDCAFGSMDIKLPPNGMATADFSIAGLSMDRDTSQYFTTPTAIACGEALSAVNGLLTVDGTQVGLITGFDFAVNGNVAPLDGVVGSTSAPDLQFGKLDTTGNMTVYFQDGVMRDLFLDETVFEITVVATSNNTDASDFIAYTFPKLKASAATEDDGEKGLVLTMPFVALENPLCGLPATSSYNSSIVVQDSTYV